jgi:hypothetical protein
MCNRLCNILYLIVVILLLNSVIIVAEDQPDLKNILDQTRKHLNNIYSIRYSSSLITTGEEEGNILETERIDQTFVYDKGKYRTSVTSSNIDKHQFQQVMAFNGYIYQELLPDLSTLNITRTRPMVPYGVMEIITTSYLFAIQPGLNNETSLEALRKDQVWQNVKKLAKYHSQKEIRGHQCVIMGISYPSPPGAMEKDTEVVHTVAFAEDLNWFPLRIESEVEGILASRWDLNNYVVNRVGDRIVVMPLSLEGTSFNFNGGIRNKTKLIVEPKSVEINIAIPEEIFTIPASQVDVWQDNDLGVSSRLRLDLLDAEDTDLLDAEDYDKTRKSEPNSGEKKVNELSHNRPLENVVAHQRRLLCITTIVVLTGAAMSAGFITHVHRKKNKNKELL